MTAAALSARAAVLVASCDSGFRIVARSCFDAVHDGAFLTRVAEILDETAGRAEPQGRTIALTSLPGPFVFGVAAPLGRADDGGLRLLLALGPDPIGADDPPRCTILADLAQVAECQIAASDLSTRSADVEASHVMLRDLIDVLPDAIAVFDRDDRFSIWNERFEQLYGGPGVEVRRGMRLEDYLRRCVGQGDWAAATGREEWILERLGDVNGAGGPKDHDANSGALVRVQDYPLAHGGTVSIRSDVTHDVEREKLFRSLFDSNPTPMLLLDVESLQFVSVNDAAVSFYGYPRPDFLRLKLADIRPEGTPGEILELLARLKENPLCEIPSVHVTACRATKIVKVSAGLIHRMGRPTILAAVFDITEGRRMQQEISHADGFLSDVVDQLPQPMFVKDMWNNGRYVLWNAACEELIGVPRIAALGKDDRSFHEPSDAARFVEQDKLAIKLRTGSTVNDELFRRGDGTMRWMQTRKIALKDYATNQPRYILGVAEDITDRRESEARVAHMAHHDILTDLPNRFLLNDRLQAALARLPGSDERLAILYIDLDGFKQINDGHGHSAGDAVIRASASRLRDALRVGDTVARMGGDEFVVLLTPMLQPEEAAWVAHRLVTVLRRPFEVGGQLLRIGASIGIACAPSDGIDAISLIEKADAALYRAKRAGKSRFCFFDNRLIEHHQDNQVRAQA